MHMYIILGGTSVSGGVECPANEKRMIVSLDTSQMVKSLPKWFHLKLSIMVYY